MTAANRSTQRKVRSEVRTQTGVRGAGHLRQIIEGGRLLSSESDNRSRCSIKAVHKFGATVMLGGHPRDVVATIRETVDGTFHYDLSKDWSDGTRFLPADAGSKPAARMPQGAETGHGKEGGAATTGNVGGNGESANPVKASLTGGLNLDFAEQQAEGMPADKLQKMVDRVTATLAKVPAVRVVKGAPICRRRFSTPCASNAPMPRCAPCTCPRPARGGCWPTA